MTTIETAAPAPHAGTREQWATRAAFLVAGFTVTAWAPLVPYAKMRLEADEGTLGLLLLSFGLGSIIAMPLAGILASRFGCRRVILISGAACIALLPTLALASTLPLLALCLCLFGAALGGIDVAMNIQAVMVEKDSGKPMMSGFHGVFSLGGILGSGGLSLLLGFGLAPIWAVLVVCVLCAIPLAASTPGLLPYGNSGAEAAPHLVWPRGIVLFIGALCFLVFLAEGSVLDWSAVFLNSVRGVDPAQAGFAYTAFAIAMAIGRLSGDWINRRVGGQSIMIASGLLTAAGFAVVVAIPSPLAGFAGYLLVGLGTSNVVPVLFSAAGRQTAMPPSLAIAAISTIGYAGILAGPALIGLIANGTSLPFAFGVLGVAMLAVSASYKVARI